MATRPTRSAPTAWRVLAAAHEIPFYVAAPLSTFDLSLADRRPDSDRAAAAGGDHRTVSAAAPRPKASTVYNPAFDVTPARLIRAIICERGRDRAGDARADFGRHRESVIRPASRLCLQNSPILCNPMCNPSVIGNRNRPGMPTNLGIDEKLLVEALCRRAQDEEGHRERSPGGIHRGPAAHAGRAATRVGRFLPQCPPHEPHGRKSGDLARYIDVAGSLRPAYGGAATVVPRRCCGD